MARRTPPRKVTYFEPVAPRLARNTVIESTFEVGRRFRCTMRVDCGELDPGAVIRPVPGEWHPRMPERLDDEELADWRRRTQCGLSACRPDNRRPPCGRRRIRRAERRRDAFGRSIPMRRPWLEGRTPSGVAENAFDHADRGAVDLGDLGDRHAVFYQGADAGKLRRRELARRLWLAADRNFWLLATDRRRM